MELSIYLAKIFGLFMAGMGLAILINLKSFMDMVEDFMKNTALKYLAGIFLVFIGGAVVFSHNVWTGGWPVLVTFIGWAVMLKGLMFLIFPKVMKVMAKNVLNMKMLVFGGVTVLVVGIYLLYTAFTVVA